tara:strand:+ start:1168 stop:1680 length:513 start_codon:yes stop_codon:yes gene_type:complete
MKRFLSTWLVFLFCASCASNPTVGYSSASLYAKEYHSVAVPIFQNETMTRNMEFMLTDAVIKEIQSRTPYAVLGEKYADTILTGTITNIELDFMTQSKQTGLDNEMLVEATIDFKWTNLRNDATIAGRNNFTSSALFIPSQPSSEPMEIGQFAVVQQLASDIVDQMQASW